MARCPPGQLDDLADLLAALRTWPGVVERRPGVFYLRREPFLHFHLHAGRRRADVKGRRAWAQVDLPRPAGAASRRGLAREVRRRYAERAATNADRRPLTPPARTSPRTSPRASRSRPAPPRR